MNEQEAVRTDEGLVLIRGIETRNTTGEAWQRCPTRWAKMFANPDICGRMAVLWGEDERNTCEASCEAYEEWARDCLAEVEAQLEGGGRCGRKLFVNGEEGRCNTCARIRLADEEEPEMQVGLHTSGDYWGEYTIYSEKGQERQPFECVLAFCAEARALWAWEVTS